MIDVSKNQTLLREGFWDESFEMYLLYNKKNKNCKCSAQKKAIVCKKNITWLYGIKWIALFQSFEIDKYNSEHKIPPMKRRFPPIRHAALP